MRCKKKKKHFNGNSLPLYLANFSISSLNTVRKTKHVQQSPGIERRVEETDSFQSNL